MAILHIRKRDGRIVPFHQDKIAGAISKAFTATCKPGHEEAARRLADEVVSILEVEGDGCPDVEHIQDLVERVLMDNGHTQTARAYILYRSERSRAREMNVRLMSLYEQITCFDGPDSGIRRETVCADGDTAMGSVLRLGSEGAKQFYDLYVLNPDHARAHREGDVHIHDLDYLILTTSCCQMEIRKLFRGGFSTGHGTLREPNDISSCAALACIAIQSIQSDQHGGQSIADFDYGMADGVRKTFVTAYRQNLSRALMLLAGQEDPECRLQEIMESIRVKTGLCPGLENCQPYLDTELPLLSPRFGEEAEVRKAQQFAHYRAAKETDRAAYQAMEALIHNLSTMRARPGGQPPFSAVNYGMDTSPEGRMVIRNMLLATEAGLGGGETALFPIQIFRVKEGVNYNAGDPNYDLFQLAVRCTAKRPFPNFSFLDAPFHLGHYKPGRPETEAAYAGCRTRVLENAHDPDRQISGGRGNLFSATINLPRLAIRARGEAAAFFGALEDKLDLCIAQLLERLEIQSERKARNYPFLMGQGVWMDSDRLGADDEVREALRHGTLSVGFVGLAETLEALVGEHHGQSARAQALGLEIVGRMRTRLDGESRKRSLNFTLLAAPAHDLSGRFARLDRALYGVIGQVTDRDCYTNSFHIPACFPISAHEKIRIEAPYHALTNGGHITYVEVECPSAALPDAIEGILREMKQAGVGCGAVSVPADRDPVCGFCGTIDGRCPGCGRTEADGVPFVRGTTPVRE